MNRTFKAAAAALILVGFAGSVAAGPFEDAMAAWMRADHATALRLFRTLAEQGNVDAQAFLGFMYETGAGAPHNDATAVSWFRKAAEHGNSTARAALGIKYLRGEGVPQDYVMAHVWFNLAAASGDKTGAEGRDMTAAKMTPAQILEAQKRAREWKPTSTPALR
jgi:uncharacterized protein